MERKKIETYHPKKRFIEKVKHISKPTIKIFFIFVLIFLTVSATKYVLEKKDIDIFDAKISNQIIMHSSDSEKIFNSTEGNINYFDITSSTNYSTLVSDLSKSGIVQDLPKDSILKLQFYNFDSGQREWEKSYNLKKNLVEEGDELGDIQIMMDSKYVGDFKVKGPCEVLTDAKDNGDFGIETKMSQSALMWKYKNMLKYRDCLGI